KTDAERADGGVFGSHLRLVIQLRLARLRSAPVRSCPRARSCLGAGGVIFSGHKPPAWAIAWAKACGGPVYVAVDHVVTIQPGCGLWLAQWLERRPDLLSEQFGLFPGGEVAALGGLVEVGEVGVDLLGPAARGLEDLAGEDGEADR